MNHRLLTTEELLEQLEKTTSPSYVEDLKKHRKKKKEFYIFWGIVIVAVLHLLLLSFPLIFGVKSTVQLIGQTRVIGIPYTPGNVSERIGHVVVIKKYDMDQMDIDDHVIVYGIQDTDLYWDVVITDFDDSSKTVSVSFDGVYSLDYTYDDIMGVYEKDANVFGIILFVASRLTGILSITALYASIAFVYYILVIREMKVIDKESSNEQNETKE